MTSLSSPFRIEDLPEELFINILALSFGDRPPPLLHKKRLQERGTVLWRTGPPATYALVCRSWRKLVFSSPRLWSSVMVNSNHLRIGDAAIRLFVNWLTRAKSHPLTIELYLEDAGNVRMPPSTLDILLAFVEMLYSKYVRELSITLPRAHHDLASRRLSALLLDAPWLETFSLRVPALRSLRPVVYSSPPRPLDLHIAEGVPNLRVININSWLCTASVRSRQTSLTKLILGRRALPLDEVLRTLQNTPQVESFQVTINYMEYPNTPTVRLAHLRDLSVSFFHVHEKITTCSTMDYFFLSIRAPRISKVVLNASHDRCRWETILNFISNSSQPPIAVFSLSRIDVEVWRLQFALSLMPKLETLTLGGLRCMDGISKALKIYRSPSAPCPPCPNLQVLRIEIPKDVVYDAEEFTFMIFSRCRGYYLGNAVTDGDALSCLSPRSIIINNVGQHEKETLLGLISMEWSGCANYTCKAVGRNGNTLVITKLPPRKW